MTETPACRMARTMPELDSRELSALGSENHCHGYSHGACPASLQAVFIRAEDAAGLAVPSEHIKQAARDGVQPWQGWVDAYWAALP